MNPKIINEIISQTSQIAQPKKSGSERFVLMKTMKSLRHEYCAQKLYKELETIEKKLDNIINAITKKK